MKWILTGALVLFAVQAGLCAPRSSARKYELKLIYIFEGKTPEYVFVIGDAGFKSVERLKDHLGGMPAGTEIVWNPGCERLGEEPLLSSERQLESFRKFLGGKGIKLTVVRAG